MILELTLYQCCAFLGIFVGFCFFISSLFVLWVIPLLAFFLELYVRNQHHYQSNSFLEVMQPISDRVGTCMIGRSQRLASWRGCHCFWVVTTTREMKRIAFPVCIMPGNWWSTFTHMSSLLHGSPVTKPRSPCLSSQTLREWQGDSVEVVSLQSECSCQRITAAVCPDLKHSL